MNDRELLELAAKAAGYWNYAFDCYQGPLNFDPLTDDGDALRLAVKLGTHIRPVSNHAGKRIISVGYSVNEIRMDYIHEQGDDLYAATRRAIVRAAAEIGKAMEG